MTAQTNSRRDNAKLAELLRQYRLGGSDNALLKQLRPLMLKVAGDMALKNHLPFEFAEEAVQEVFAKWQKKGGILAGWSDAGGASVATWIRQPLKHALIDIAEKESKHSRGKLVWEDDEDEENDVLATLPGNDKTHSSLLRLDQLSQWIEQLGRDMVGKTVRFDDGATKALTENHCIVWNAMFRLIRQEGEFTDEMLGQLLGVPRQRAGAWKLEIFAYIRNHPRRDEIMELLNPIGRPYLTDGGLAGLVG